MRTRFLASPCTGLPLLLIVFAVLLVVGPAVAGSTQEAAETAAVAEQASGSPEPGGSGCCRGCRRGEAAGESRGSGGCKRRGADSTGASEEATGGCGKGRRAGRGGAKGATRQGQGGPGRPEMAKIHDLLDARQGIQRRVEQIPDGVRTTTITEDPETLELLRSHVRDMENMIRDGGHIRRWDPLYAELLEQSEHIRMEVREIENGVEVTETSDDPWVRELIRAHATKVVEFVYRGWEAYREPTAMPERPEAVASDPAPAED